MRLELIGRWLILVVFSAAWLTYTYAAKPSTSAFDPCTHRVLLRGDPVVIGDSVTVAAAQHLHRAGLGVDARVCRALPQGIEVLARRRPSTAVLALGANGRVRHADLETARRLTRRLVLVTPSGRLDGDRGRMIAFRRAHPDVGLVDWWSLSQRFGRLRTDRIHTTRRGARDFSRAIVRAIQRQS